MLAPNRLRFHYKYILRPDLLLKLNYSNIMEVPRLCKVVVVSQMPYASVQNMALAMDILCGQKSMHTETSSPSKKSRVKQFLAANKNTQPSNYQVQNCLRADIMYSFLEKLITVISFSDYIIQIHTNSIQLTISANLLRLFPEIQNYFELFESTHSIQVIVVTSAKTEKETRLLWTGLLQKEV